ncbi:MAG: hypothetical protein ACXWDN_14440, partial [Limisphaerales bacterium]
MATPTTTPTASKSKRRLIWFAVLVVGCFLLFPFLKRTFPGRLVRFIVTQQPLGRQIPNDLADDVRDKRRLASLQDWSVQTLARYQAGQVATNGKAAYWSKGTVRLASSEVPSWLSGAWSGKSPEVSVRLSEAGEPECITIGWYLNGLLVGPTNYRATAQPW